MENNVTNNSVNDKNIKLYSILAYIGILWIVGCLVKEKDDKKLKFHVGQGILVTLSWIAASAISRMINLFNSLVIHNIFVNTTYTFGVAIKTLSPIGSILSFLLGLVSLAVCFLPLVFMIIGIVNAANNKEQELPLIGQFAFYK